MNIIIKIILPMILITSLSSCKTAYVEQGEYGGIPHGGYSNVTTNSNTATVSFRGASGDSPGKIKEYLLYRCAEVAQGYGYDYFVIVSTSLSPMNINLRTQTTYKRMYPPTPVPDRLYADKKVRGYSESESVVPYPHCGPDSPLICQSRSAVAVIKMFNGRVPPGLPRAYSVSDVIAHIGPAI